MLVYQRVTHRILTVLLYMVCHGSHPYTPFMLAYIPAPWILWVMVNKSGWWFQNVSPGTFHGGVKRWENPKGKRANDL